MTASSDSPTSAAAASSARGWRFARRLLLAAAALATLTALFYTVENWRGQRAWENRRRELEAKGEVFDWAAYVPPPVPDDQNFYKAPKMREWFVREHFDTLGRDSTNVPNPFVVASRKDTNLIVAEVSVVAPEAPLDSRTVDAVLRFDDPSARAQAEKFIRDAIGPCVLGARGGVIVAASLDQFKPAHLALKTATVLTLKELTDFLPCNPLPNSDSGRADVHYLGVGSAGSNVFRVYLKEPVCGAADYLAWTEPLTANFDLVRKALERPYARIDCDYQQPFAIAIPNFVRMRTAVQTLSERAQCNLLLNRPEEAWHELSLVHDLCEILKAKPSGKPITLVGAMINVAIADLYANIVKDGLRLHSWREPELLAIEKQLQATDLLAPLAEAFREERAASLRTFGTTKRRELVALFNFESGWSKVGLLLMPRGWFFQNMAVGAGVGHDLLASIDLTNRLVRPRQIDSYCRDLLARLQRRSPYTFLVVIATPNFTRAIQTTAHNQTAVDQARLACALERYRLSQGQYPDTLDALTPRTLERPPHDVIGGQSFKYRRLDGGGYLLYSIGWNEKDDGGIPVKSREEGDWVWSMQ